jgi:hypothetical protein
MENIIRDVRDIGAGDRLALEHVVGIALRDDQRLIIQIVGNEAAETTPAPAAGAEELPQWCNVYEGLSDEEIAEVEKIALTRAELTRPAE